MEITDAWENLAILEQFSISSKLLPYTPFLPWALQLYTYVSKNCSGKVWIGFGIEQLKISYYFFL